MVEIPSQGRVSTLQHLYTSLIEQTREEGGEEEKWHIEMSWDHLEKV